MGRIANLFPGYFALVMATGIVSIAAFRVGMGPVAWALVPINLLAYGILLVLTGIRAVRFWPQLVADVTSHVRGPGFLTLVAGTCVLGNQLFIITGVASAAWLLWGWGVTLWAVILYTLLTVLTVRADKPSVERSLSGTWLLVIVATQAVSVLTSLLASQADVAFEPTPLFLCTLPLSCRLSALSDHYHAHCLPPAFSTRNPGCPHGALLDQHGCSCHHYVGRGNAAA